MKITQEQLESLGLTTGVVDHDSDMGRNRFIPGFTRGVNAAEHAKGINDEERTVVGIASTINLDRHGEVILPSAIAAHAREFMASNAPFLASHEHRTATGSPAQIGWVMDMAFDAEKVTCRFKFDTGSVADDWWKLASNKKGKGIAFSIGFWPIEWVRGSVSDVVKAFPELKKVFAAAGLADTDYVTVYTEVELAEISGCGVPANRESVQVLMAKFMAEQGDDGDDADQSDKVKRFVDALGAKFAEKLGEQFDEKIGCLESLRFDVEEKLEEIKCLIAGDSYLDGPDRDRPDRDSSDGEERAGQGDKGEVESPEVTEARDGLLAVTQ